MDAQASAATDPGTITLTIRELNEKICAKMRPRLKGVTLEPQDGTHGRGETVQRAAFGVRRQVRREGF